jgi:biopolymer transport protein ExbB
MKLGKRRWEAKHEPTSPGAAAPPPAEPGPQSWAVSDSAAPPAASVPDPVVDGEAVELPSETPVAEAVAEAPAPAPVPPVPVGVEPVAVVTSGPEPGGTAPLAEAAPYYASGHAPGTAPSWPEPVMALAAERPEAVVGAAFVGGILLAAILRRLGH